MRQWKKITLFFSIVWRISHAYVLLMLASVLLVGAQVLLNVLLPKFLIDELTGALRGTYLLLYAGAIVGSNLIIALLSPLLGAIGDFRGMKKKLFAGFLLLGLVFTAAMAVFDSWQLMLVGLVISRIGFSGSCLFYDSFLTDVTAPERMDKVSA